MFQSRTILKEGLKDALKFAKSAEQASAAERQKAIAAIKAPVESGRYRPP